MPPAILPLIAIVGRPNVGKSTLFNRLLKRPAAIVEDEPGVTRDRLYGEVTYDDYRFILVDTGGLDLENNHSYMPSLLKQAGLAIDEADAVIFMTEAKSGLNPQDSQVAALLRKAGKPTFLAVNKADSEKRQILSAEFYELGFSEVFPISASHGLGIDDLFSAIFASLKMEPDKTPLAADEALDELAERALKAAENGADEQVEIPAAGPLKIAIIGRPNVGKSSILNALLGEERALVANMPGTTRDAIDTALTYKDRDYIIIDTAGLRKKNNIAAGVERFAAVSAIRALERADVAIMVLDSAASFGEQDIRIMSLAEEKGCGLVIALNKWDLVPDKARDAKAAGEYVGKTFPALAHVPVVTTSAITGRNIYTILDTATKVANLRATRIPTAELNRLLERLVAQHAPPALKRRRAKFFFITQVGTAPVVFVISVSNKESVDDNYKRYIINAIRERYHLQGVPIRLILRERGKRSG